MKNLKQALVSNEVITISDDVVIKYNLPSNKIELQHFCELINIQNESELFLTPKLKIDDIRCNNFNKMKVNKAKHVFSNDVSSSFQLLADENNKPEYITTAWFVKIVSNWFSLMTSRHCKLALGKKSENVYNESINFLNEIIDIFTKLKIGKGDFKPVQRGIVITTKSVIDLTQYLITHKSFKFVLTSRFTQDCIENLFSQIRQKNVPNPLQFKNDLKLISIAMFMKYVNNSNYENDDQEYLSGFIEYLSGKQQNKFVADSNNNNNLTNIDTIPPYKKDSRKKLTTVDLNSLYNIAGYILRSITKMCKTYINCIKSVQSKTSLQYSFTKFVQFKCYNKNSLFFVNIKTFKVFILLEKMFRHYSKYFDTKNINWKNYLIFKFSQVPADHIRNCHELFLKIIKRFVIFRLRILNKKDIDINCKRYDSRSMAMHTLYK